MYHKEIIATVNLAHYFESAFTPEQVFRYLRIKMERSAFDEVIEELKADNTVFVRNGAMFTKDLQNIYQQKKCWSKKLFSCNKLYLFLLSKTPWIKYIALTGANSFESCYQKDDIDLFMITKKERLWLSYVFLVIFSKITRKRGILCINYLVDENNLRILQQNYFTAVQIVQMIPLFDNDFGRKFIKANSWIFDYLPNARPNILVDRYYLLNQRKMNPNGSRVHLKPLSSLNRLVYQKYSQRLLKKYPDEFGNGIVLKEGVAKLNRIDHQDIYENIYENVYEKSKTNRLS